MSFLDIARPTRLSAHADIIHASLQQLDIALDISAGYFTAQDKSKLSFHTGMRYILVQDQEKRVRL